MTRNRLNYVSKNYLLLKLLFGGPKLSACGEKNRRLATPPAWLGLRWAPMGSNGGKWEKMIYATFNHFWGYFYGICKK